MRHAIRTTQPYSTKGQKTLSTLATVNSAIGHTAGLFGGVAVGVNVAKAMEERDINIGVSIATGFISAIAVMAGASVATETVSGALRKKAGVVSPLSMLGHPLQELISEDYGSLLENIEEEDDDSDNQEPEHEGDE